MFYCYPNRYRLRMWALGKVCLYRPWHRFDIPTPLNALPIHCHHVNVQYFPLLSLSFDIRGRRRCKFSQSLVRVHDNSMYEIPMNYQQTPMSCPILKMTQFDAVIRVHCAECLEIWLWLFLIYHKSISIPVGTEIFGHCHLIRSLYRWTLKWHVIYTFQLICIVQCHDDVLHPILHDFRWEFLQSLLNAVEYLYYPILWILCERDCRWLQRNKRN